MLMVIPSAVWNPEKCKLEVIVDQDKHLSKMIIFAGILLTHNLNINLYPLKNIGKLIDKDNFCNKI